MRTRILLPLGALAVAVPTSIVAQTPPKPNTPVPMNESVRMNSVPLVPGLTPSKPNYGVMYFNSRIGSFKIVGPGEQYPEGSVTLQCHGTVLISDLQGTVVPANMNLELNDTKLKKQVYFGNGRITVRGKFKNIQFFGRDLKAAWDGFGIIRFYGEFDKNLETGLYWYGNDPTNKLDWGNGGMTQTLPQTKRGPQGPTPGQKPRVRVRDQG